MTYTQKYTIAQLMEPLPDGTEYSRFEWPLHVTLADVFAIDLAGQNIMQKLTLFAARQKPFATTAGDDALFGPNRQTRVTLLQTTLKLQSLHDRLIDLLAENGATFNSLQFTKSGFKPHATVGSHGRLNTGDTVHFSALTLIDMFPDHDPHNRRVLGTFKFSD